MHGKYDSFMKIAIVHKSVSLTGGAERYMRNLAVLFTKQGFNVSVYAGRCDLSDIPDMFFNKVKIIPFLPFLKILSFAVNSKKAVQKKKYDLVAGMGNVFYQDLYFLGGGVYKIYAQTSLLRYRTFLRKALRHIRRLLSPSHWLKLYIERKIFISGQTKFFVCPSQIVANELIKMYAVDSSKIKIIRNGIDTEKFNFHDRNRAKEKLTQMCKFSNDDFIFLFVSSNHFLKGLESLLDAFYLLNKEHKNVKVVIAGKGRENFFKRKTRKMGLTESVKFAGWQKDIRGFYKAADFFIYPTFYDPFPNVILESFACGLPAIVSSLTGACEIIDEGKNGFVIKNPRNINEIYSVMKKVVLLNKNELRKMSYNARGTAEGFSNEKYIERILNLTREICPS